MLKNILNTVLENNTVKLLIDVIDLNAHRAFAKHFKFSIFCFRGLKDERNAILPRMLYAATLTLSFMPSLVCFSPILLTKIAYKSVKKIKDILKHKVDVQLNIRGIINRLGTSSISHVPLHHTPLHIMKNVLDIIFHVLDIISHFLKIVSKSINILCRTAKSMYETPLSIALISLIKVRDVITGKDTVTRYDI